MIKGLEAKLKEVRRQRVEKVDVKEKEENFDKLTIWQRLESLKPVTRKQYSCR